MSQHNELRVHLVRKWILAAGRDTGSVSAGTSCHRKASKCARFRAFFFSARLNKLSKCPRQRAGFSPSRRLRAFAASRICSICPRTSSAVLVLAAQMGCSTLSTWVVPISSAENLPMWANAYSSSLRSQPFRHFSDQVPPCHLRRCQGLSGFRLVSDSAYPLDFPSRPFCPSTCPPTSSSDEVKWH